MATISRLFKIFLYTIAALAILAFGLNSLVRVSGPGGDSSVGIVEDWLFGGPASISTLFHSDNFNKWDESAKLTRQIAQVIQTDGARLLNDPGLEAKRVATAAKAAKAYKLASAIPDSYLAKSNPQLPKMFNDHLVKATQLWSLGIGGKDSKAISEGIHEYNQFLTWLRSQGREAFKTLR